MTYYGKPEYHHHTKIKIKSRMNFNHHPLKTITGIPTMYVNKRMRQELSRLPQANVCFVGAVLASLRILLLLLFSRVQLHLVISPLTRKR